MAKPKLDFDDSYYQPLKDGVYCGPKTYEKLKGACVTVTNEQRDILLSARQGIPIEVCPAHEEGHLTIVGEELVAIADTIMEVFRAKAK